ncbi:hypothetical protein OBBRIDRAFT_795748 [Obba rivulosa]|uniref:DNA replication checkpoint mediator MRC1 domain-containing protein n=1 Tax=Obba rivulosa TaxID=1052685 RepID=A0A8E2DI80_9APHY|nr:hypothetical protein OBBRIDRAFT_795748 [Obba rivulosa]
MADATLSQPSSPPQQRVKRAAVTYGRRKSPSGDGDTSFTLVPSDPPQDKTDSVVHSADEDLPPSSLEVSPQSSRKPSALVLEDTDDEDDEDSAPSKFEFEWRQKLQEVDYAFEHSDAEDSNGSANVLAEHDAPFADAQQPYAQSVGSKALSEDPSQALGASPLMNVRHSSPLPSLQGASSGPSHLSSSMPPSTPPSVLATDGPIDNEKGKHKALGMLTSDHEYSHRDTDMEGEGRKTTKIHQLKRKNRGSGVKRPSKKEQAEMKKATARLVAERPVSVPRIEEKRILITDLWKKLGRSMGAQNHGPLSDAKVANSDPIVPFSSSPATVPGNDHSETGSSSRSNGGFASNYTGLLGPPAVEGAEPSNANGDEDMPDIRSLLQEEEKKRAEEVKRAQLGELKRRALEHQRQQRMEAEARGDEDNGDDDDDLVIVQPDMQSVVKEEARSRKSLKNVKTSLGRVKQLALAGPLRKPASKIAPRGNDKDSGKKTFVSLEKGFASARPSMKGREQDGVEFTQAKLNQMLRESANEQAMDLVKGKEEEWLRLGGKIQRSSDPGDAQGKEALLTIISKGLSAGSGIAAADDSATDSGGSDEDWIPDQDEGQGSGEEGEDARDVGSSDEENAGKDVSAVPKGSSHEQSDATDDGERLVVRPRRSRFKGRTFGVLDSEDENDDHGLEFPSTGSLLIPESSYLGSDSSPRSELSVRAAALHRTSMSSLEDGTDKENDMRLMFDRGEDKENTAIAIQSPVTDRTVRRQLGQGSRHGRTLLAMLSDDEDNMDGLVSPKNRAPLQDLAEDGEKVESHFDFPVLEQRKSPSSDTDFVQPDDLPESDKVVPVRDLSPSPSILKVLKVGGLSQFFTQQQSAAGRNQIRGLGNNDDLSLTLDVSLQPALEITQGVRQKADNIFEKEQESLVEKSGEGGAQRRKLYINDDGFFTQTLEAISSPGVVRRLSVTQTSSTSQMSPTKDEAPVLQRQPLEPLDLDVDASLVESEPRRRLMKRQTTPPTHTVDRKDTPSPSPSRPRIAFDRLAGHSRPERGKLSKVGKLEKSEFIEGEAEESDDDAMVGFGIRKPVDDDGENDGEDQDQILTELMDDAAMDERTLAAQAVLEKVREHEEEDDRKLEKLHMDVVEGKYRHKRRSHGVGFEDSDSDEDEDDRMRRQRAMRKKRRLDGDKLDELAKHQETLAFVQAYHADMVDDDNEFAHLQNDEMPVDEDAEPDEEQLPQETVSAEELRRQLQEASRSRAVGDP